MTHQARQTATLDFVVRAGMTDESGKTHVHVQQTSHLTPPPAPE